MIFEGEFFSGGHLRWNLGWPTPNYAGAFVATLVVLLWSLTTSRWRWMGLIAEAAGLFLLAKTYSRGAVVAWGLAWGFGILASRGWESASQRRIWTARVGLLAAMLLVTGFGWSRAAPRLVGAPASDLSAPESLPENKSDGASKDGSVVNRLALWRGGLQMIAAAPLTGWGAGESGRAYMNWYQDIGRTEGYSTMVNSYLHIGVEQGLPVLGAVLCILVWLLATAWRRRRSTRCSVRVEGGRGLGSSALQSLSLLIAAGAAIVAWAVANVFTTLWIEPKLWIVPIMAALTIAVRTAKDRGRIWWPALGWGALSGLHGVFLLWLGGIYLGRGSPLRIEPIGGGAVLVTKKTGRTAAKAWHMWTDTDVLGRTPGQEIRRWMERPNTAERVVVHLSRSDTETGMPVPSAKAEFGLILFGRQVERLASDGPGTGETIILVHPRGQVPSFSNDLPSSSLRRMTVVLPEIDQAGDQQAWRQWAETWSARIVISPGVGRDIRAAWPGALGEAMKAYAVALEPTPP